MSPAIDVILCAHNPRDAYLRQTLESLRGQHLPPDQWRLWLVDNASDIPLSASYDLSWHPFAAHIHAPQRGLIHARIAGIEASSAPLLVFVDDDNILSPDYLSNALGLVERMPFIGVFGGVLEGVFERPPPDWLVPDLDLIAVRGLKRSLYANFYHWEAMPVGAGMVIRSAIARRYAEGVAQDPRRVLLGRNGSDLAGGEDVDMVLTAIDMGYSVGRFKELFLQHLIPGERLERSYILRLLESTARSQVILDSLRAEKIMEPVPAFLGFFKRVYRLLFAPWYTFQKGEARERGRRAASRWLRTIGSKDSLSG